MKIQQQPNKWSCFPTALAMCIDVPVKDVIEAIGHDGSERWWRELPEPYCRRSFHPQEIVYAAEHFGYDVVEYEARPVSFPGLCSTSRYIYLESRFFETIVQNNGILVGRSRMGSEKDHAVAWNGSMCHDPNGHRYALHYFDAEYFFRVAESKFPKTSRSNLAEK